MTLGFVMLAHAALHRAAAVAAHLARQGAPVVVHIDRRASRAAGRRFANDVGPGLPVTLAPRRRCDWGTWSIVAATLDAVEMMLERHPDVTHVCLVSGSCLPLRPVRAMEADLAGRPDVDLIESAAAADARWARGGLDTERFSLVFPFAWKRRRRAFDLSVALQRRLGVRRRPPPGIVPFIGSQWWCLTRETLRAILHDPERERTERYFRHVWIPDESYFQTAVRRHARRIESRSPTFSRFDDGGRPHFLYDDHADALKSGDHFFARKVWPGADGLYSAFLCDRPESVSHGTGWSLEDRFEEARHRRTKGRAGLTNAGRFPRDGWENGKTAAPYTVLEGLEPLFPGLRETIAAGSLHVHGHLYSPDGAEFDTGEAVYAGGISSSATLRDYNPGAFLANVIRSAPAAPHAFFFGPRDHQAITSFIASDAGARVIAVRGGWLLPLLASGRPAAEFRDIAAHYQLTETEHLAALGHTLSRCGLTTWTLAEAIARPTEVLAGVAEAVGERERGLACRPADVSGIAAFVDDLRNAGFNPTGLGDLHAAERARATGDRHGIRVVR